MQKQRNYGLDYNLAWQCTWFFNAVNRNWSGFMQSLTSNYSNQRKDRVTFLPIIDLNPSDENCIFSTLCFICKEAARLNIQNPTVTFDQPLWLKATGIIEESQIAIVCRLGGFHTMMSFLGSMRTLMKGSGLESLFAEVYAENTVGHIISGKAVSRALRAHFLVEAALTSLLLDITLSDMKINTNNFNQQLQSALQSETREDIERFLDSKTSKCKECIIKRKK